jgi:hypothetical protein
LIPYNKTYKIPRVTFSRNAGRKIKAKYKLKQLKIKQ